MSLVIHVYDNRHIKDQVDKIKKDDTIVLINALSRKRWSLLFKYNGIDESVLNVTYITKTEFFAMNNKIIFDQMIANPPYSDGDVPLYPPFFEKGLEIAKNVIMVMPVDLESGAPKLKAHNNRVKKHMISMSKNVTKEFGVGIPDIRYIKASKATQNIIPKKVDKFSAYKEIFPKRNRLNPRRGMGPWAKGVDPQCDETGIPCIGIIHRGNKLVWTNIKPEYAVPKKGMKTDAPWLVLVNENPSSGLFNTHIMPNDGTLWLSGIFAFDARSKKEAVMLEEWLVSPTIQAEVKKLLKLNGPNTYSFSGPMVRMLSWYE